MRKLFASAVAFLSVAHAMSAQATFHGDNARTGVYASSAPHEFHGVKWAFKTGGAVIGSPVIAGGVLYVGSSDGTMYAIDQATGQQKWKYPIGTPIVGSPAVANGLVYFLCYDGVFRALSADSGKRRWAFLTGGERRFEAQGIHGLLPAGQTIADPMDLFLSSPVVAGGKVYFGSSDGHVYALDARTGVTQWSFATGDVVHASPSVVDSTLYVGSWDSYLYALNTATGQVRWRFKAGDDPVYHNQVGFQSSPAVVHGMVYVGCRDGHVYAIDAATGTRKWDYGTSQSWVNSTPAVADGAVYFSTADTHRFQAVDAATGTLRYALDTGGLMISSAALADGMAFVGTFTGKLLAIDTRSGALAWEFQTDGAKADRLKVLGADGRLSLPSPAFDNFMDMTVRLYQMFSVGAVLSSPVVDGGVVFFGSADGSVYAID